MPETEENNFAATPGGSPTWLAVLAASSLGVILLIAGLSLGSLSADSEPDEEPESAEAPESEIQSPPVPAAPQKPAGDWTAALYGSECPAPCSAGSLCATTEENTLKSDFCFDNKAHCDTCSSKMTCVPGEANLELARGELWKLHLSTLRLNRKDENLRATQPEPCEYERDYWVCLRPARGKESWTCLGVADACSHGDRSEGFITISTEDLIESGLDVEVRYSRPNGPLLLPRSQQRFERGMKRRGLCNGFKKDLGTTRTHEVGFTFFLEPAR